MDMKYILLAVALLTTSCSGQWLQRAYERETFRYMQSGFYFRNANNGLCYFVINSYRTVNPSCVPCDSLKNEKVVTFYPQKLK
jgi:hypothetical protein